MCVSVRLLGGPDEVDEVCARLAACVGAEPRAVLRDGDSEAFHDGCMGWEADATVVARLTALPDQLGRVLERPERSSPRWAVSFRPTRCVVWCG